MNILSEDQSKISTDITTEADDAENISQHALLQNVKDDHLQLVQQTAGWQTFFDKLVITPKSILHYKSLQNSVRYALFLETFYTDNSTSPYKEMLEKQAYFSIESLINYYNSSLHFMETEDLEMNMQYKISKLITRYGEKLRKPILLLINKSYMSDISALVQIIILISKQVDSRPRYSFKLTLENLIVNNQVKIRYAAAVGLSYIGDKESLVHLKKALAVEKNNLLIPVLQGVEKQLKDQRGSNGTTTKNY